MESKAAAHVQALNAAIGPGKRAEFVTTLKSMIATLNRDDAEDPAA